MTEHWLKLDEKYKEYVEPGGRMQPVKAFELRKMDRDFKDGDDLYLCIFDGKQFTGEVHYFRIEKVWTGLEGLKKGYAILSSIPFKGWYHVDPDDIALRNKRIFW